MASGQTIDRFTPLHNEPTSSIAATLSSRNQHPILVYDAAADQEGVFSSVMAQAYSDATGVTLKIKCQMATATSGNVVLQAAFEKVDGLDTDGDSFAAFQSSGQVAVPGTAGEQFEATIALTKGAQMDSTVKGNEYRLKVRRDADDTSATDDATGNLEVRKVEVRET